MVSFSAYAAAALAFAGAVRAGFYTTYPIGADAIASGQTIQIKWQPDSKPVTGQTYTLKFMTGGNLVQTTVATIGTFPVTQTTVPFTVPKTAPGMYFLMYTSAGGDMSWSTRFSINGGTDWYPSGVATGRDPTATESGKDTSPTDSVPNTRSSSSSSSTTDTTSTDTTSTGSSDDTSDTSDTSDTNTDTTTSTDTDTTEPTDATDDTDDTTDTTDTGNTTQTGSSTTSTKSSTTTHASRSSDSESESDSEPDSESSGALSYVLSVAAILAASLVVV